MFHGDLNIIFVILFSSHILLAASAPQPSRDYENYKETFDTWIQRLNQLGEGWKSKLGKTLEQQFDKDVTTLVDRLVKLKDKWWANVMAGRKPNKESKKEIEDSMDSVKKFFKEWKPKIGIELAKKFGEDWNKHVEDHIATVKQLNENKKTLVRSNTDEIKNNKDWVKEIESLLDKIKNFGEKWINTADQQWKEQISEDWASKVIESLNKIKELAYQFKDKFGNDINEEFEEGWKTKVQEQLDEIHQFGQDWKPRVKKQLKLKFASAWDDGVEDALNSIKEVRDYWKQKADKAKDFIFDKIDKTKDAVGDLIKGIPDFKKLSEHQDNMDSKFPLPLDLEGVKVNYHRQKICVKDGGEERCVTKNDVPGSISQLEDIFRVVVQYEILADKKKYNESGEDNTNYSSDYKKHKPDGDGYNGDDDDGNYDDDGAKALKTKPKKKRQGK